jgi:hypothetical protein
MAGEDLINDASKEGRGVLEQRHHPHQTRFSVVVGLLTINQPPLYNSPNICPLLLKCPCIGMSLAFCFS